MLRIVAAASGLLIGATGIDPSSIQYGAIAALFAATQAVWWLAYNGQKERADKADGDVIDILRQNTRTQDQQAQTLEAIRDELKGVGRYVTRQEAIAQLGQGGPRP